MPTDLDRPAAPTPAGPVRAPQSLMSGLVLLALAALALWLTRDLPQGTLRAMGPGMLPRWLAVGVGLCGIALVAGSFTQQGSPLERASLRGPLFVALGVVSFALVIRPASYLPISGLAVAGPLAMVIGGFATPEVRWKEILIFAAVMTAFCIGLFRYALNLPIPILTIPGVIQI